ncbi:hypothetical protein AVEN_167223-1 [Araneus ventricosus]|uniref:Uncharacterized protein n=1 Tax=Araneus ventricosus TaxID=182803 RepID=A0A4Y2JQ23_ARAVE|nr:hypothetical protein AVEN_167223-1 [Araneus ventricosus]
MVVKPLYTISLQKVFSLLENGLWNSCEENPFSFCPTKVVEDLTTIAYSDAKSMSSISLLLTSGRIYYLHLMMVRWELQKDLDALLKMLSEDVCRNIRKLSIPKKLTSDGITLLEAVLRRCSNLEDVYSEILFDLSALTGCKEMRYLRFHVESNNEAFDFTSRTDFDVLRLLNNLKILAFCNGHVRCFLDHEAVAKILLNSPKLISVGYVDTLNPLAYILNKESDSPPHFELRRCFWGHSEWDLRYLRYLNQYKSNYPEYIKMAVSFCPFVEDLVLLVFHKECLQHLTNLQHLTFLCLNFHHYGSDDYISDLISFLKKIGPQLRHIAVEAAAKMPLDVICDLCPNLESLLLVNPSITESAEPSLCLKRLKRLSCGNINKETLMYLLSNCRDLTELTLSRAECLEDGLLTIILKRNPLPKLKVVLIRKCSLSKDGLRLLLLRVPSLERVYISNKQREVIDLINELNLETEQLPLYAYVPDFFCRRKFTCTF